MAITQMTKDDLGVCNTKNPALIAWVEEVAKMTQPDRVYWCSGSEREKQALTEAAVAAGILIKLSPQKWPGCYLHRSNPNDVARVEQCTFICTESTALNTASEVLKSPRFLSSWPRVFWALSTSG